MNNNKHIAKRRAGFAGLLLTVALTVLGAGPSSASETYIKSGDYLTTRTFDYQPTYQDLSTARISRVGITPIPIP